MEKLMTTKELCEHFNINKNTANNWRRAGLPYIQINKRVVRYNLKEVQKWYDRNKIQKESVTCV